MLCLFCFCTCFHSCKMLLVSQGPNIVCNLGSGVSEWVGFNVPINTLQVISEIESFQSITCTGTDNLTRTTKRKNTQCVSNRSLKVYRLCLLEVLQFPALRPPLFVKQYVLVMWLPHNVNIEVIYQMLNTTGCLFVGGDDLTGTLQD